MLFKSNIDLELFSSRLNLFDGIENYNQLLNKYLMREPHTLLNIGHAINFFKIINNHKNALSIGICPVKEWALIDQSIFKKITVYDIDKKMILKGNALWKKKNIPIKYVYGDILNDKIPSRIYDSLILFQMDYIFSDSEIQKILLKAKSAGILHCLVITPSLFNLSITKDLNIFFHEIGHLFLYLYSRTKSLLFPKLKNKKKNKVIVYKRSYSHFVNIFSKAGFGLKEKKFYLNPNGSFNFFLFKIAN